MSLHHVFQTPLLRITTLLYDITHVRFFELEKCDRHLCHLDELVAYKQDKFRRASSSVTNIFGKPNVCVREVPFVYLYALRRCSATLLLITSMPHSTVKSMSNLILNINVLVFDVSLDVI
jgi:hypothetical protein